MPLYAIETVVSHLKLLGKQQLKFERDMKKGIYMLGLVQNALSQSKIYICLIRNAPAFLK